MSRSPKLKDPCTRKLLNESVSSSTFTFVSYYENPSVKSVTDRSSKQSVDRRTITENYDLVSLAIDEIVDDGIILETDPTIIVTRVSKAPTHDVTQLKSIDLSEQGINNLAQLGKSKFGEWLRQGL